VATNYNILTEQIQRLYNRGIDREDLTPRLDRREIKLLVTQAINTLIKPEHLNRGDVVGSVIATYDVQKQSGDCYDFVELPVLPISLPKEQGIHRVHPTDCPWKAFVPIMSNDFQIVQGTPSQYIEGQVGYYQDGKRIVFTKSVPQNITLKLIVHDPSQISDTDIIPIPAEMESQVIEYVLRQFELKQVGTQELNSKSEQIVTNPRNE